ncbi:MAG: hypothetical protein R2695_21960 [Acidimicrobiales bacterium]
MFGSPSPGGDRPRPSTGRPSAWGPGADLAYLLGNSAEPEARRHEPAALDAYAPP